MDEQERIRQVVDVLRFQAGADEPLYRHLLNTLADDILAGGATWRPLAPLADLPATEAVPLRLLGAAHRLALAGDAPDYARHLPTCGGDGDASAAWPAFRNLCAIGALDDETRRPVQTNEPVRTAALVPGFALIAAETGLPLRLLEVGASAGLLLRFDRYQYDFGDAGWGDPRSPVCIVSQSDAPVGPVPVVDRRGCDVRPLDPVRDRLLLLSFVWPSQVARFERVDAALTLATTDPVPIDEATAPAWLEDQLSTATRGVATVVYHSIVWQYLSPADRAAATSTIAAAGAAATPDAPLAWLRFEPHRDPRIGAELRLTRWPGGEDRSLALCGYHGTPVRWGPAPP